MVQELSGLAVNHFVGIDFHGFKGMVEAVQGVEVCVERPLKDEVLGTIVPEAGKNVQDHRRPGAELRARPARPGRPDLRLRPHHPPAAVPVLVAAQGDVDRGAARSRQADQLRRRVLEGHVRRQHRHRPAVHARPVDAGRRGRPGHVHHRADRRRGERPGQRGPAGRGHQRRCSRRSARTPRCPARHPRTRRPTRRRPAGQQASGLKQEPGARSTRRPSRSRCSTAATRPPASPATPRTSSRELRLPDRARGRAPENVDNTTVIKYSKARAAQAQTLAGGRARRAAASRTRRWPARSC